MWLLSTDRAKLHFFHSVEMAQRAGYVILSHVWTDTEQTFQETRALLVADRSQKGYNPRDHSSPKVRELCILAERHGYRWIWNDTCCIDKTSSSELSEAINSMFSYYAHSELCYAYLADVPPGDSIPPSHHKSSSFARSRWFQRGWTLQELIAPAQVVFLSSDWKVMGTKADHAEVLTTITRIPVAILTFELKVWDVSIARRMSWASTRQTSRLEDEAYALMGIFDVYMPIIYGEGRNAFRRLQEEIMRQSIDTSLFAWGDLLNAYGVPDKKNIRPFTAYDEARDELYLLARSPRNFQHCADHMFVSSSELESPQRSSPAELLASTTTQLLLQTRNLTHFSFEITPYGVHARMPVIHVGGLSIAVLNTSSIVFGRRHPLGLLLGKHELRIDSVHPLYRPCIALAQPFNSAHVRRLVDLDDVRGRSPEFQAQIDKPSWEEFYLAHVRPRPPELNQHILSRGTTPFHIPGWFLIRLQEQTHVVDILPKDIPVPWKGDAPVALKIHNHGGVKPLFIHFGRCTLSPSPAHWVHASFDPPTAAAELHNCSREHLEDRPTPLRILYTNPHLCLPGQAPSQEIRLSFVLSALSPGKTYILIGMVWKKNGRTVLEVTADSHQ